MTDSTTNSLIDIAADVTSAYVSNNKVAASELPGLLQKIHDAFRQVQLGTVVAEEVPLVPAVAVKKSVTPDYIVCLEDGRKFKSLKRHLSSKFGMTPDQYRTKWNLPKDYPMVAPNYAAARSELARKSGLGRKPGTTVAAKPAGAPRGRRKVAVAA